jgi:hypothetical protein
LGEEEEEEDLFFFNSSSEIIRIKPRRMTCIEFIVTVEEIRNARKMFFCKEKITLDDKCRWDLIDCISLF